MKYSEHFLAQHTFSNQTVFGDPISLKRKDRMHHKTEECKIGHKSRVFQQQ